MRTSADSPIQDSKDDQLGRDRLAEAFAQRVTEVDCSEQGVVVGVLGPWGSGKTSFANLVRTHLNASGITVVDFNPWMFSGTTQLVDSFFIELAAQLRVEDRLANVGQRLAEYGEAFSDLGWVPVVGPWLDRIRGISRALKKLVERRQKGTKEPRERLREALVEQDEPFVVVLDDIDRLTSAEIRQVFKLIRLIANLPNIVYLVAFDRQRVEQALAEDGVPGRDYLEKILQVAVDLPAIPTAVLHRIVFTSLDDALEDVDHRRLDQARWPDVFVEIIHPLVQNMRDVTRYANAVHWTARDIGEAVDLVDLLALEAVRVFLPDVFAMVPMAFDGLTKPSSNVIGGPAEPDDLKMSIQALVEAGGEHSDVVRALVDRVFPAGSRHLGGTNYGPGFPQLWLRSRRVAHPDLLRFYIERVVGDSLAAFDAAERAFELMAHATTFDSFLRAIDPRRREDVVGALESFEEDFEPEQVVPGVTVLLNLLRDLPERPQGMFDFGPRLTVARVTLRLLRILEGPEQVESAVDEILPNLRNLSLKLELLEDVGYRSNRGHQLVTEEFADRRLRAWRDQVRATAPEELAAEHDLGRVLLVAARDSSDDEDPVAVPDVPEVTAALLTSLISESRSQAMGSRAVHRDKRIGWDVLVEVVGGEDETIRRIEQISETDILDPDAIELAKKYASGWRPADF